MNNIKKMISKMSHKMHSSDSLKGHLLVKTPLGIQNHNLLGFGDQTILLLSSIPHQSVGPMRPLVLTFVYDICMLACGFPLLFSLWFLIPLCFPHFFVFILELTSNSWSGHILIVHPISQVSSGFGLMRSVGLNKHSLSVFKAYRVSSVYLFRFVDAQEGLKEMK